jgi:hypothetical protein
MNLSNSWIRVIGCLLPESKIKMPDWLDLSGIIHTFRNWYSKKG